MTSLWSAWLSLQPLLPWRQVAGPIRPLLRRKPPRRSKRTQSADSRLPGSNGLWLNGGNEVRRTSILLADDHVMICEGLKRMLEPEFEVIACVQDGHALVRAALHLKPDLVLVDVGMPMLNGLDAARELKALVPGTKLIFLTMHPDPDIATEALRIGAAGYLLKNSEAEELLMAVRHALRGTPYVTPQIKAAIEESVIRDLSSLDRPDQLSARQREVLQMLVEGRPMREVAEYLQISPRTVRFHKRQFMKKLGFKNNAELIRYAVKNAIIFPK
jgi:DNA-binding NarL/FixJ family response regulator